jgi:hypothetical protein
MEENEERNFGSVIRNGDKKVKGQDHAQYQLKNKATAPAGKFKCFN